MASGDKNQERGAQPAGLSQTGGALPVLNATRNMAPNMAKDPVCGMDVNPETAREKYEYAGRTYYFCCRHCLEKFAAAPHQYLNPQAPAPSFPPAGTGASYTCPMHPEVVRDKPGACPICGMALEPRTATAHLEVSPELADMTRRFWVSAILTLPVLAIAMAGMAPLVKGMLPSSAVAWVQFALATPVVLWGGKPFFERGWASLVNRSLNMFTLIAAGAGTAYAYSVVAAAAPGVFPLHSAPAAKCRFISKRRRRSPRWCCSGRCSSCARAAELRARSAPCSALRRQPPAWFAKMAQKTTCH